MFAGDSHHFTVFCKTTNCNHENCSTKARRIPGSNWMKSLRATSTSHIATKTPSKMFHMSSDCRDHELQPKKLGESPRTFEYF